MLLAMSVLTGITFFWLFLLLGLHLLHLCSIFYQTDASDPVDINSIIGNVNRATNDPS